ncbi:MAG TPA: hypothetical protein PKN24_07575 [bacterium]|nr:hypothetical protein [bacterium]
MKKPHLSAKILGLLAVFLLLVVIEGFFDWIEIGMGEVMRLTNRFRPQIGRLWEEEAKDLSGEERVSQLLEGLPADSSATGAVLRDLGDLLGMLSLRQRQTIQRDEFLQFYRRLGQKEAQTLVGAEKLYSLFRNPEWQRVNFTLHGDQLAVLFVDGFERLLHETYVPVDSLYSVSESSYGFSTLVSDDRFAGRIVPAQVFYRAFDRLSAKQRQALLPDLYQLIEWGNDLKAVAISRVADFGRVELAFEVKRTDVLKTVIIDANAAAVSSLITKLNALGETAPLMMPIEKGQ